MSLCRSAGFSIDRPKIVIGLIMMITLSFLFPLPKIITAADPENMPEVIQPNRVFYDHVKNFEVILSQQI